MGGAPFGFFGIPQHLAKQYQIKGIVNMCDEYKGPTRQYERLGMTELRLQTVDHFVPSLEHLEAAVDFIRQHEARGERVYVHCRAGHGRSAAAVLAWMVSKDPVVDVQELNRQLRQKRYVRKSLWKQTTLQDFHRSLLTKKRRRQTKTETKTKSESESTSSGSRSNDESRRVGWEDSDDDDDDLDGSMEAAEANMRQTLYGESDSDEEDGVVVGDDEL